ncbi:putative cation efflux pump [Catenaria anguillulae PL171]|uniref:Putative cation efflux pump n=1 Tax=Catenaria anguillulae PL171 TaxID=765915 RepID=A0A1Y2HTA0_9FUNG|nr:putative cation efflux pump [Catenaria anguillulae PL171]
MPTFDPSTPSLERAAGQHSESSPLLSHVQHPHPQSQSNCYSTINHPTATLVAIDPDPTAAASSSSHHSSTSESAASHSWLTGDLPHHLSTLRKSPEQLQQIACPKLVKFYNEQNDLIDDLLAPVLVPDEFDEESAMLELEKKREEAQVTRLIWASLGVNLALFVVQVVAASSTGSMALLATATDSFMDLLSGVILAFADHAAKRQNLLDYPTGKRRFETIGTIVFASLMSTLSLQIIVEGIRGVAGGEETPPTTDFKDVVLIGAVLAAKFCLLMYCNTLSQYTSAKTLATDHRNDLVLNSFGLTMSLLGVRVMWWLDPVGGIGIGLLILRSWAATAWENVQLLIGRSVPPAILNKLIYVAATHHPAIRQIETCRAYWLGTNMFVEIDIVLPPDMSLKESHDIGESLQIKIEHLPNVERAFVHVDHEVHEFAQEHRVK